MFLQFKIILFLILFINVGVEGQRPTSFTPLSPSDYCEALQYALLFYKYNRAGELPSNFEVPWRSNSVPQDGLYSGGYFDAGDTCKFVLPMASAMTILSWAFIEFQKNIESCGLTDLFLDDIRCGTDWLMLAHRSENEMIAQIGEGRSDHLSWAPPELNQLERPIFWLNPSAPGTEVAMEASAALSAASVAFKDRDPTYSSNLISHAKQLHNFGYSFQGNYSNSLPLSERSYYLSSSGYNDEIVWATAWLYKATGDTQYLNKAKEYYIEYGIGPTTRKNISMSWDQKSPGASLLMLKLTNDPSYAQDIEGFLNNWLPGGVISKTGGGLAFYDNWGSCRYAANTAFLASIHGGSNYHQFAKQQINYILGDNPNQQSFVVGIGPNYPVNPHHRASHHSEFGNRFQPSNNVYLLKGALVGGPSLDDSYQDDRMAFTKNEVALDYNAGFAGALSHLVNPDGVYIEVQKPTPAHQLNPKLWETDTWLNNQASQYQSPTTPPSTQLPQTQLPSTQVPTTLPPQTTSSTTTTSVTQQPNSNPTTASTTTPTQPTTNVGGATPTPSQSVTSTPYSNSNSLNPNLLFINTFILLFILSYFI